jgi:flagellar basal-body rod protein FlgG
MLLKAAIRAPAGLQDILIDQSGSVSALVDGARQSIGTIDLVMASAHDLKDLGGGLFQATSAASLLQTTPGADGSGLLAQGYIENSNVDLSNEMVSLMVMQRAFAANSQVIQAADQLMAIANGLKR